MKPRVYRAGDETRFTGVWYDTELGTNCVFWMSGDGKRCVPYNDAHTFYLDEACTVPVIEVHFPECYEPFAVPVPRAATSNEVYQGCGGAQVYRVGGERIMPAQVFGGVRGQGCSEVGVNPYSAYYPAESVAEDELVASEFIVRKHSSGLDARVRANDDGSWAVEAFHDPNRGGACLPSQPGTNPAYRCLPSPQAAALTYTDSLCETMAVLAEQEGCREQPSSVVLDRGGGDCDAAHPYDVFELGASVESRTFPGGPGSCDPRQAKLSRVYPFGDRLEPTSLPKVEQLTVDAGRLAIPFVGFAGEPFFPDPFHRDFWDKERKALCSVEFFFQGKAYCLPERSSWIEPQYALPYFQDPDCFDPVFQWAASACGPQGEPAGVMLRETVCGNQFTSLQQALPFTGETVYYKGESCTAVRVASVSELGRFYVMGEPLDFATFPEVSYEAFE